MDARGLGTNFLIWSHFSRKNTTAGGLLHQKAAMAEKGTTMPHMLMRFIFALKAVSPPPRMMPVSQAI